MPVEIPDTITEAEYNALDNPRKAIFSKQEDGTYKFDDVPALRQSYYNEKSRADRTQSEFDQYKSKYKDIDPAKYNELKDKEALFNSKGKDTITLEEHNRRTEGMRTEHLNETKALKDTLGLEVASNHDLLFQNTVIRKLKDLEVDEYGMEFLPGKIKSRIKFEDTEVTENGAKKRVRTMKPLDESGNELFDTGGKPADVDFLIEQLVSKYDRFVPGQNKGGAGAQNTRTSVRTGDKSWGEMSSAEKSNLGSKQGQLAVQNRIAEDAQRRLAESRERRSNAHKGK